MKYGLVQELIFFQEGLYAPWSQVDLIGDVELPLYV
jgi:hypothetical protein